MTCRAMRLRFLPWVWETLELSPPYSRKPEENTFVRTLNTIARALDGDTFLAASVKYICAFLCPCVGADLRPLKVLDSGSHA